MAAAIAAAFDIPVMENIANRALPLAEAQRYFIRKQLKGRYIVLCVDAQNRQFFVKLDHQIIKRLPIKGLYNQQLPFQDYVNLISKEALSEWRSWRYQRTPRSRGGSRCR